MRRFLTVLGLTLLVITGCQPTQPTTQPNLTVIGFNVESGDANPDVIAQQYIKPLGQSKLWGFSEVADASWVEQFAKAANSRSTDFQIILGTTGDADRLAILYDRRYLEKLKSDELGSINIGGDGRAPLVAHFRFKPTGTEFLFMVNHLYRSRNDRRHEQARLLNQWARKQTLPVIALGDYNFDWDVVRGESKRDQGYDLMTQDQVLRWVRPQTLTATQCSDRYDSVLDFVFVAGSAKNWPASAEILYPQTSYCPDDQSKSDHRPVKATFNLQ
ncbi:MAG: endonuclease/exonuclease/phosphatase family protein [Microcoleaceae cyanobacterium]